MNPVIKKQLQNKYGDERVYVVTYGDAIGIPDKFTLGDFPERLATCGKYVLRSDAEYNDALVQPIPYILVTNKAKNKYYVTERLAGDERLKDSIALGSGGHIDPVDHGKAINLIEAAAHRELNEELKIQLVKDTDYECIGTVRDLTSETHEHLGIVYMVQAAHVSVKEKDKLKGRWMTLQELINEYNKFESWARYIIDYLYLKSKE